MKKVLITFLLVVAILLLAACGQEGPLTLDQPDTATSTVTEEQTLEEETTEEEPLPDKVVVPDTTTVPVHQHSFSVATCTAAAKCSCGETSGSALGHKYQKGTCTRCGAKDSTYHEHSFSTATCTEASKCSCGLVKSPALGHSYKEGYCTVCKGEHPNLQKFLQEAQERYVYYAEQIAEMDEKIAYYTADIEKTQQAIDSARNELASLSPSCPQWFIQQYVSNWQAYGSTAAATQAAQRAWSQQYSGQQSSLNNTISMGSSALSVSQQELKMYLTVREDLVQRYNQEIAILQLIHGIQ